MLLKHFLPSTSANKALDEPTAQHSRRKKDIYSLNKCKINDQCSQRTRWCKTPAISQFPNHVQMRDLKYRQGLTSLAHFSISYSPTVFKTLWPVSEEGRALFARTAKSMGFAFSFTIYFSGMNAGRVHFSFCFSLVNIHVRCSLKDSQRIEIKLPSTSCGQRKRKNPSS